jgi:hypothetical protein
MNEKSFRILQISTSDIAGGAEKIAWDLFTSYRNQGHQSWLTVGAKKSQDPKVLYIPNRLRKSFSSSHQASGNSPIQYMWVEKSTS